MKMLINPCKNNTIFPVRNAMFAVHYFSVFMWKSYFHFLIQFVSPWYKLLKKRWHLVISDFTPIFSLKIGGEFICQCWPLQTPFLQFSDAIKGCRAKKKKATHEQDCEVGEGEAKQEIVGGGMHALVPKVCQYWNCHCHIFSFCFTFQCTQNFFRFSLSPLRIDDGWCWLILINADWCSNQVNQVFLSESNSGVS